jgi:transcriptional regulator with XRE-family HTH domain
VATATRLKKRLGSFLCEMRKRVDKTMEEAADHLKIEKSTVCRYETGEVMPVWSSVHMLLTLYSVSKEELAEAALRFQAAKDEPRSVRLTAGAPKAFRTLVNAEREAVRERELAPFVIPGLLQTKRYTEALFEAGRALHKPAMRPDTAIATRMDRKKPLDGPDPMLLHALIDEAVIRREIGGPDVLSEQLDHLLSVATWPNITLQVISYTAGGYGPMAGSFIIIDYPEPDTTPGVYLEYPAGGAWVDDKDDVQRFTTTFDQAAAQALSPADSIHLIRQQLRACESHDHPDHSLAQEQLLRR